VKAISIRQPWAWLIVHGFKDVENRTWATNFRGRLLIHAGRTPDPRLAKLRVLMREVHHIELPETFELGGIVGEAEVIDCVKQCASAWFSGPFGFILAHAKATPFAPCKGKLSLFNVPLT
jgi:hypothetical protein